MPTDLENSTVARGQKRSVFIPIPKKGSAKDYSNYSIIALISHTSKVMLNSSSQASTVRELRTFICSSWIYKRQRNQRSNCQHSLDHRKSKRVQKNISFCFTDYAKAFECVDYYKLWKILKEMGTPNHFTCLLTNLCTGQEATVRTGHGTIDWFQIGKGVCQGCISSPYLFNIYADYIM